ncbi:unnamed protein product, partial [Ixodes pacificus]
MKAKQACKKKQNSGPAASSVVVEVSLFLGLHLHDGVHVVLVRHTGPATPQRDHAGLDADGLALGAVEVVRAPRQLLVVHVLVAVHLPRVDLHDPRPGLLVGVRKLNLPIQPARTQQRGIQDVYPVGGRDDFDVSAGAEPIQLVEQLEHGPLDFAVSCLLRVEALRADGVQFVDEDDGRRLFLGEREGVSHQLGAVADEHLNELRSGELQERRLGLGGTRAGHQRLAGAGRSVQEDTFGRADAQVDELLLVGHWEHDGFDEFLDLFVETADVGVLLCGTLVHFHRLDPGVVLLRQRFKDEVRVLVNTHQVARAQLFGVDESDDWQKVGLTGGGLDDGAFTLAERVEVHVGAVLFAELLRVDVEELDDVGHQVRQGLVDFDLLVVLLDLLLLGLELVRDAHHLALHDLDLVVQEPRPADNFVAGHPQDLFAEGFLAILPKGLVFQRYGSHLSRRIRNFSRSHVDVASDADSGAEPSSL